MCERPRTDVVVYDRVLKVFKLEELSPYYRQYLSDPSIKFDEKQVEKEYMAFIVHRMLLYDHKRGIRRASKVGRSSTSYKTFRDIMDQGPQADPTHV